ncbi:MAG: metabolite traffic protein EboE [Acidobacteriota bacterium]
MKVAGFDLTYCSNIHAGESWPEVAAALTETLPVIRHDLGVDGPIGIGLRLSARAAAELAQPGHFAAFERFLREGNGYVPTINGFPYGAFHGQRVKERVYLPDWRSEARLAYSNQLADLLARLIPPDATASVSTVPGGFRSELSHPDDVARVARQLLAHAAHLAGLRAATGRTITLAIEPEPACLFETVAEALAFIEGPLWNPAAIAAAGAGLTVEDVHRHIGLCLDACHMAVEFEDLDGTLDAIRAAGVGVFKVQVSSALQVPAARGTSDGRRALEAFADDTYLHQVVVRDGAGLTRFTDLPDALAGGGDGEWRVHFHVPLFLAELPGLETSQAYVAALLRRLRNDPVCTCLEVETYTWDVLPRALRDIPKPHAIARELAWARRVLLHG